MGELIPLTGLIKASGSISKLGISCATDWPMFVKWLLNASAISPGEVKTWFPVLTWDALVDLLCRGWSSLIHRQVLRGSLLFASRFSEKYLRLAFFTELLALFLASLNCFQIEGSFVDAAFFFRKSLLCISRNSSFLFWMVHAYQ